MNRSSRNVRRMQRIDRWIGVPVCLFLTLLRGVSKFLPFRRRGRRHGLLFIKLAEQGSTVLAADAVAEAARERPIGEVYFLVFAENREILDVLGWLQPANIYAVETRSLARMFWSSVVIVWKLRRVRLETSIDLEFFARATAILGFLIGASRRIGFTSYPGAGPYRGNLLTDGVLYNPRLHTSAAFVSLVLAQRQSGLLPALPVTLPAPRAYLPSFAATRVEEEYIRACLDQRDGTRYIVLNANAGDLLPLRRWPAGNYLELAGRILREWPEVEIILTGNAAEREAVERMGSQIRSRRWRSLAGRTTLRELLTLYNHSEILVTNDSGPAHFATLTGIDCITLFGPETPDLFAAPGPRSHPLTARLACSPCVNAFNNRQTLCRNNLCLQAISVEMVFARVREIYRRRVPAAREIVAA